MSKMVAPIVAFFLALSLPFFVSCVDWSHGNWAFDCDINNNGKETNIMHLQVQAEACVIACDETSGCTHFVWTPQDGGNCLLKGGPVSKSDVVDSRTPGIVCGIKNDDLVGPDVSDRDETQATVCGPWAQEGLEAHNKLRAKHSAPPLKLKKEICDWAQNWANTMASDGSFRHRPNNKFGENLFMSFGSSNQIPKASAAVQMWYDEIKDYDFSNPGFSMSTGHFTQVVWKGSTDLGMAMASISGKVYVVANYNPPGNFQGQFPANVLPLIPSQEATSE